MEFRTIGMTASHEIEQLASHQKGQNSEVSPLADPQACGFETVIYAGQRRLLAD